MRAGSANHQGVPPMFLEGTNLPLRHVVTAATYDEPRRRFARSVMPEQDVAEPSPPVHVLRDTLCSSAELFGDCPTELPDGFVLRPTPSSRRITNRVVGSQGAREVGQNWRSNLYGLKMGVDARGREYKEVIGRLILHDPDAETEALLPRVAVPPLPEAADGAERPATALNKRRKIALEHLADARANTVLGIELMFMCQTIMFRRGMLDAPKVQLYPLHVPLPAGVTDVSHWARTGVDEIRKENVIPAPPPGAYLTFGRLPNELAVNAVRLAGTKEYELRAKMRGIDHPVEAGKVVFPPMHDARRGGKKGPPPPVVAAAASPSGTTAHKPDGAMALEAVNMAQDGGLGFFVVRHSARLEPEPAAGFSGQLIPLYARFAFGDMAFADVATQHAAVASALQRAVSECPGHMLPLEQQWVSVVHVSDAVTGRAADMHAWIGDVRAAPIEVVVLRVLARQILESLPYITVDAALAEARFRYALGVQLDAAETLPATDVMVEMAASSEQALADDREADSGEGEATTVLPGTVLHDIRAQVHVRRVFSVDELAATRDAYRDARAAAEEFLARTACTPAMFHVAPPDVDAFGERPVVVVPVLLRVRAGITEADELSPARLRALRATLSGLATRVAWSMMLHSPQLQVLASHTECYFCPKTVKPPGLLNVGSACKGTPVPKTYTTERRRTRNPHGCLQGFAVETVDKAEDMPRLPPQPLPVLSREEAAANPFLQAILRGPTRPFGVAGTEVSVYEPGAHTTILTGTNHTWAVVGAIIARNIDQPRGEDNPYGYFWPEVTAEQRESAKRVLYPPFYNAVACEIFKGTDGAWNRPGARRYAWEKAYGVNVGSMVSALFWLAFPKYPHDFAFPAGIDLWELSRAAEAEMNWMSRLGRCGRALCNKSKREPRSDYALVIRNYYAELRSRAPGAPIANLWLSGHNAFRHALVLGEHMKSTRVAGKDRGKRASFKAAASRGGVSRLRLRNKGPGVPTDGPSDAKTTVAAPDEYELDSARRHVSERVREAEPGGGGDDDDSDRDSAAEGDEDGVEDEEGRDVYDIEGYGHASSDGECDEDVYDARAAEDDGDADADADDGDGDGDCEAAPREAANSRYGNFDMSFADAAYTEEAESMKTAGLGGTIVPGGTVVPSIVVRSVVPLRGLDAIITAL